MSNRTRKRERSALPAFKRHDRTDHGTRTCYVYGRCRCDECRDAQADYWHVRKRKLGLDTLEGK